MAIGIPTEEFTLGAFFTERLDLSNSEMVNESIEALHGMLQSANWSDGDPQYAKLKLTIDLPVVNGRGPFSIIVFWWYGFAYQIWNPERGDVDPSGNFISGVAPDGGDSVVVGVPVSDFMGQNEIIDEMATMMAAASGGDFRQELTDFLDIPGEGLDGVANSILFTARSGGPQFNDITGNGNVNGGSLFNGVSKFGGYQMKSELSPSTFMEVTLLNIEISQLLIKTTFGAGPYTFLREAFMGDIVMHRISRYTALVGPLQFILTPTHYPFSYSPDNIIDVLQGQYDYWICAPKVPDEQLFKPGGTVVRDRGITAAAFRIMAYRNVMNSATAGVAVCDTFLDTVFGLTDVGMTLILLNTFSTLTGPLLTPAEMPIQYSALVSLSDAQTYLQRVVNHDTYITKEALICGYIWDAHITSRAEEIGTKAYFGNKQYWAYRVQHAPCEATLWMFTGVIR